MEVNAEYIKKRRTNQGWTQQHLADMCGISLRTVQRVERYGQASNETVSSLASVFEVDRVEIIEFPQKSAEQVTQSKVPAFLKFHLLGYMFGLISGIALTYLAHSM